MVIDIIIAVVVLLAVILGIRQGFITQLCYLVAIVLAAIIAPTIATPLGSLITDTPLFAYVTGFAITLLAAVVLVWLIAPLLKRLLVWDFLRKANTILGATVAFIASVIIVAVACTTINTLNLGHIDMSKAMQLAKECDNEAELEAEMERLLDKDASMRDYFTPRFVEFETLEASILFDPMVALGDVVFPGISTFRDNIAADLKHNVAERIANRLEQDGRAE